MKVRDCVKINFVWMHPIVYEWKQFCYDRYRWSNINRFDPVSSRSEVWLLLCSWKTKRKRRTHKGESVSRWNQEDDSYFRRFHPLFIFFELRQHFNNFVLLKSRSSMLTWSEGKCIKIFGLRFLHLYFWKLKTSEDLWTNNFKMN